MDTCPLLHAEIFRLIAAADTRKKNHLKVVSTTRLPVKFRSLGVMRMAAVAAGTDMLFRMDVLTVESACHRGDVGLSAAAACMHIKPYDTQRVPYHKQHRRHRCTDILHTNLQRYKKITNRKNEDLRPVEQV